MIPLLWEERGRESGRSSGVVLSAWGGGREGGRESSPTLQLTARDVRTEMIASHRPAPKYCTLLGPGVFYTYLLQVP